MAGKAKAAKKAKPKAKATPKAKPKPKPKVRSVVAKKTTKKRRVKKTFTLSIADFVYFCWIIKLLTGRPLREILQGFLDGSIKENLITLGFDVIDRLEAEGIEISIEAGVVTFIKMWYKKAIGRRAILKLGPLRIVP